MLNGCVIFIQKKLPTAAQVVEFRRLFPVFYQLTSVSSFNIMLFNTVQNH